MHIDGSVSSIDLGVSNSTLDAGVMAASHHIDTLLELMGVVTEASRKRDERDHLHRYVSRVELTHSRLVEVAASINQPVTPISRHSLEGGGREEVDGEPRCVCMYVCAHAMFEHMCVCVCVRLMYGGATDCNNMFTMCVCVRVYVCHYTSARLGGGRIGSSLYLPCFAKQFVECTLRRFADPEIVFPHTRGVFPRSADTQA